MPYIQLITEWKSLVEKYPSWTLTEVQQLSWRERQNWIELSQFITRKE